jgi:hypothetical protein
MHKGLTRRTRFHRRTGTVRKRCSHHGRQRNCCSPTHRTTGCWVVGRATRCSLLNCDVNIMFNVHIFQLYKQKSLIKLKLKLSHYTPRISWGERRYSSYSFSTSALDGGEWSASLPGRASAPGERTPSTHCTGGLVGPRAGLDTEARGKILSPLPGIELRSPGPPSRSQTVY